MERIAPTKYLITSEQDLDWGLVVTSVGSQRVKPNVTYPPTANHPVDYLFSTDKGRILDEYQLIYISEGKGEFVSSNRKKIAVNEGVFILLFPGEWHNYNPDKNIGWCEYWIGFKGENIDNRLKNKFFKKEDPILNVGLNEDIVALYKKAIEIADQQETGFMQMLAGITNLLLGYAYAGKKQFSFDDMNIVNKINKAKMLMLENLEKNLMPEEIAESVNMSYSWFRKLFKQYTGISPAYYMQELKIKKSKDLLINTTLTSKEIAFELGFETPYYFCLVFKKKIGLTPIEYRKQFRGKK
jgi:Transcriptional regulator containing an amidase domain and an AraC-type DNA-binding HTH domain